MRKTSNQPAAYHKLCTHTHTHIRMGAHRNGAKAVVKVRKKTEKKTDRGKETPKEGDAQCESTRSNANYSQRTNEL